jgi:aldose 1-epimerase
LVLRGASGTLRPVATAYEPSTGLELTCSTTLPAMQLYTGAFLQSAVPPKAAHRAAGLLGAYDAHAGFCLEAQQYPDAPNHPNFPSAVLRPGETYAHTTVYRLRVRG